MAVEAVSLEPLERAATGAAPAVTATPAAGAEVAEHVSSSAGAAAFNPDVDQWCESLLSILVGGIGIVCLALSAALGTFHS